eukprot:CAMPEP_0180242352 /NCGR_PEP_ID=MMETSP0987-20121128/33163_1 /TAXON_ID=697907 /ORGANISM="non described non described, Strain CCMP2293" /LENGTH=37 /DNA_ID= /DNA_START= /DNA_END= /DNA_ORIENTATION=
MHEPLVLFQDAAEQRLHLDVAALEEHRGERERLRVES